MSVCEIDGIRVKSTYEKHTKCHQITQQTKKPLSEFIGMIMQSACRFAYRRIPITGFFVYWASAITKIIYSIKPGLLSL